MSNSPKNKKITWVITCFSNETEFLVEEFEIVKPDLSEIRKMFSLAPDDPVCNAYPIDENNVDYFKPMAPIEFDF